MQKEFTKADLKSGMVVVTKEPCRYLVVDDILIADDGYICLEDYNNNLLNTKNSLYDIEQVYAKSIYWSSGLSCIVHGDLLWDRQPEIVLTKKEIAAKFNIPISKLKIID